MKRQLRAFLGKRWVVVVLVVGSVAAGLFAYVGHADRAPASVTTVHETRGRIADEVTSTGSLEAVTTVQVGTQVSGNISFLGADFNSIVKKGEVIARLDTSTLQAQVDQARATLTRAQSDANRARVQLKDSQTQAERATELWNQQLIARVDFDEAELAVATANADVQSADAQVGLARASLQQSEVNLGYATIRSPIDGIVISRSVDVGQTVAASMSSPTVFTIANDLTHLQINADVDESDIGRIRPDQAVRFEISTYPGETFTGTVTQVRLQPITVQNVITYDVIVDVQNPSLKLKPGMTANLHIMTAVRDDVWRVPNAALRFRPSAAMFAALGQPAPEAELKRRTAAASSVVVQDDDENDTGAAPLAASNPDAKTVDALFAPLPPVENEGEVWIRENGVLKRVHVRVGITDGQMTELIAGDLTPDSEIVTNVLSADEKARTTAAPGGLFMTMPGAPRTRQPAANGRAG